MKFHSYTHAHHPLKRKKETTRKNCAFYFFSSLNVNSVLCTSSLFGFFFLFSSSRLIFFFIFRIFNVMEYSGVVAMVVHLILSHLTSVLCSYLCIWVVYMADMSYSCLEYVTKIKLLYLTLARVSMLHHHTSCRHRSNIIFVLSVYTSGGGVEPNGAL